MALLRDCPQRADTRRRVLAAAERLFLQRGYHATSIRDIAGQAGVAVGSVFNAHPSKAAILTDVLAAHMELVCEEIARWTPQLRGSLMHRLQTMFAFLYAEHAGHLALCRAHIQCLAEGEETARDAWRTPLSRVLGPVLSDAQATTREIRAACDLETLSELLIASYAAGYALLVRPELTSRDLAAFMDGRIRLLAAGFSETAR